MIAWEDLRNEKGDTVVSILKLNSIEVVIRKVENRYKKALNASCLGLGFNRDLTSSNLVKAKIEALELVSYELEILIDQIKQTLEEK